jgi:hypothetical protein
MRLLVHASAYELDKRSDGFSISEAFVQVV